MAKTKISEFSATPANNTDIDSINIAEGCAPSGINDAIRELMAQLKDFQTGAAGDSFNGPVGTTTAAAGSFTTLAYTGALTGGTGVVNLGSGQFYKDSSGNVGIGTSSPAQRLDINGQTDVRARLLLNGTAASQWQVVSGETRLHALGATALGFWVNGGESGRFDTSGNLLVGTTSLIGSGKLSVYYTSASNQGIALNEASGTSGAIAIRFYSAGTQVGTITTTTSSTSYNTSSDYRLKNTIAPMTGALAKVAALKPVTYKWNADGFDGEGFIAHELAEVVPQCVTGEKDAVDAEGKPVYQGIDTSFLVATLTAAIQEQQAIITALTARVAALESN